MVTRPSLPILIQVSNCDGLGPNILGAAFCASASNAGNTPDTPTTRALELCKNSRRVMCVEFILSPMLSLFHVHF